MHVLAGLHTQRFCPFHIMTRVSTRAMSMTMTRMQHDALIILCIYSYIENVDYDICAPVVLLLLLLTNTDRVRNSPKCPLIIE